MSRRRGGFRIVDGLVAVAVIAVGLVWTRTYWGQTIASVPSWRWDSSSTQWFGNSQAYLSIRSSMMLSAYVGTCLAAPWGVALVAIRQVRRRKLPFWKARKPGAVACLAASAVFLAVLLTQAVWPSQFLCRITIGTRGEFRVVSTPPFYDSSTYDEITDPILNSALQLPRLAGFVVAGAWIAIALAGRWRPQRTWVDRLGRLIGLFWIVAALHFLLFPI